MIGSRMSAQQPHENQQQATLQHHQYIQTNQARMQNSLCKECSILDYDQIQEDGYVLKPSWAALVKSGEDGCRFCSLIVHYAIAGPDFNPLGIDESEGDDHVRVQIGIDESEGDDHVIWTRYMKIVQKPTKRNPKRLLCYMEPLSPTNDTLSLFGEDKPLAQDVNSGDCYNFIAAWLQTCRTKHSECGMLRELRPMPSRLINVLPSLESSDIRLETTEGRLGEWLTLSHCWGGTSPLKTTSDAFQSRCHKIPWKDLPLTFQDAVTITRRLGFRYLWIDSLCIIQDSQHDWQMQSAIMGKIYQNSALCIVAEMTADSNSGIFTPANVVRRVNHIVLPYFSDSLKVSGEVCFRYPLRGDMYEWGGPLSRRAWTLQESTMASRIIRYGKEQIYLRCPTARIDESNPADVQYADGSINWDRDHRRLFKPLDSTRTTEDLEGTATSGTENSLIESKTFKTSPGTTIFEGPLGSEGSATGSSTKSALVIEADGWFELSPSIGAKQQGFTTSERLESWYRMIDDFARRGLTYETDRLPAIAGVAKEVQTLLGYRYICGLWLEDVHWGLLWRARGRAILSQQYVAPSWSWASISLKASEVQNEFDQYERHDFPIYRRLAQTRVSPKTLEATVLQADVKNVVNNPFLQAISGTLTIRSYCQLLTSLISGVRIFDERFVLRFDSRQATDAGSTRRILLDFDSIFNREAPPFGAEHSIMLLLIAKWAVEHDLEYYRMKRGDQTKWTGNMWYALILEPTGDATYRRIGIAEIPEELFTVEDWCFQTLALI